MHVVDVGVIVTTRLVVGNQRLTIAVALDESIERRVKLEARCELRVVAVELHRVAAGVGD